jgi:hypothetical protein
VGWSAINTIGNVDKTTIAKIDTIPEFEG